MRHCGISTELKFNEFATKPDVVALMPTSHGNAKSPATVYVFRTSKKMEQLYLRTSMIELSVVHVQLFVFISEVTAASIDTYGTKVSL